MKISKLYNNELKIGLAIDGEFLEITIMLCVVLLIDTVISLLLLVFTIIYTN